MSAIRIAIHDWKATDYARRDLVLFALGLGLACIGLLILYPASAVIGQAYTGNPSYFAHRQLLWLIVGLPGLFVCATVDPKLLRRLALPAVLIAIVMLVLVFTPLGHSVSSTREAFQRWIQVGPITIQPSEVAKVAMILYAAHILTRRGGLESEYDLRRLAPPLAIILFMLALIVIEPQYGTTICMLAVLVLMVFVAGFPMLRLLWLVMAVVPLLGLMIVFWEYRFTRLKIWLDPYSDRYGAGYQLVTAFRAFQEGGWTGTELASGYAHRYLTFGHTDFVFALFAEDYGFLGVVAIVLLFLVFAWRALRIVRRVTDPFMYMVGVGALFMLLLQALVNMCVVTGLMPTTGVSLPFISYGGSSLVVSLAMVGLLVNASRFQMTEDRDQNDLTP